VSQTRDYVESGKAEVYEAGVYMKKARKVRNKCTINNSFEDMNYSSWMVLLRMEIL
jgi:hypothetical protein